MGRALLVNSQRKPPDVPWKIGGQPGLTLK
jgi:hypothetical protein